MTGKTFITHKNIISIVIITILFLAVQCLLQMSTTDIYSATHQEKYSDVMRLSEQSDIEMKDGLYDFTGKNPVITYELDNSFYYVNAMIRFSSPLEHNERIVIDYAGSNGEYTYWEGDAVYLNKGDSYVIVPLSTAWDIKTVKVYLEPSLYDYPSIESISLQRTGKFSKLALIGAWGTKDLLGVRMLALSLFMGISLSFFMSLCDSSNVSKKKNRVIIDVLAIGIIAVAVVILYQEYIFGNRLFIFNDCAGDSAGLFYPTHVNWAGLVDRGIGNGTIDFTKGLGGDADVSMMQFTAVASLFGESNVATALFVLQIMMVVISGVCLYFTGVLYSTNRKAALFVAFAYAFCAEFTIRAAWLSYSYTMLFVAIWLLAFELLYRKNIWYLMPIPVMLMLQHMGTFYQVLWIVLLFGYIIIRYMMYEGKGALKKCLVSEAIYVACVLILQNGLVDSVLWNLKGDRFQNGLGGFLNFSESTDLLKSGVSSVLPSQTDLFSGFLRTIGQNIGGITINYRGGNYLLDLTLYVGILMFLMVPIALYNMQKIKRRAYGILTVAALAYVLIYPVTMIMTAFTGMYKLSSQWIMISMIFIGAEGLIKITQQENLRKGSLIILFFTDVVVFVIAFLAVKKGYVLDKKLLILSLVFIAGYSLLFVLYSVFSDKRRIMVNAMMILFVLEVISVSWATFNDRRTFTKAYNPYYDDGTMSALNYLDELDDGFYRIEKQAPSVEDNDSLVQGYYGTRTYFGGGSGYGLNGIGIYNYLGLPMQENYRLKGVASDLYSMSILGVKYYFSADNLPDKYGYELIGRIDGISIYKSDYALPVAYATDKVFSESELAQFDSFTKRNYMLGGAVVGDNADTIERLTLVPYIVEKSILNKAEVSVIDGRYYPSVNDNEVLMVCINLADTIYNQEYSYRTTTGQEEVIYFGTQAGENVLELCVKDLESLGFSDEVNENITDITFLKADKNEYYKDYTQRTLAVDRLNVTACDEDCNWVEGTINVINDGVLVTQYPSCDIMIDGVKQDTFTVNISFTGCNISEGEHEVRIYRDQNTIKVNSINEVLLDFFWNSWFKAIVFIPIGLLVNYAIKKYRKVK